MFRRAARRLSLALLVSVALLAALRTALPWIVKSYVNRTLDKIPDYDGRVEDIDIGLLRGAYRIEGLSLSKVAGDVPVPLFDAARIDLSVQWKELFHGALVGEILLIEPRLNFVGGPSNEKSQTRVDAAWQDRVQELFPLDINRLAIRDGSVRFQNFHADPPVDVYLDDLNVLASNLTNTRDLENPLPATITAGGRVMRDGAFRLDVEADPLEAAPTFNMNLTIERVPAVSLNTYLKHYGQVTAESGTVGVYAEFAARDGGFTGYLKPIVKDLHFLGGTAEDSTFGQKVREVFGELIATILRNQKKDQVATRIPFSGRFDSPKVGVLPAVWQVLRNAFVEALQPRLEDSVGISDVKKS